MNHTTTVEMNTEVNPYTKQTMEVREHMKRGPIINEPIEQPAASKIASGYLGVLEMFESNGIEECIRNGEITEEEGKEYLEGKPNEILQERALKSLHKGAFTVFINRCIGPVDLNVNASWTTIKRALEIIKGGDYVPQERPFIGSAKFPHNMSKNMKRTMARYTPKELEELIGYVPEWHKDLTISINAERQLREQGNKPVGSASQA